MPSRAWKKESKIVKNAFISENFEFQLYLKVKIEQIWLQTKAKCLSYTMRPFSKLFDVNSRAEKGFPFSNFVQALHGVTWRSWKLDKKSMTLFPKSAEFAKSASFHFYIQSFSLTECIVIVGVRKYRGCLSVCLCVCVCVCLSVCVSVCLSAPERQNYCADFHKTIRRSMS